MDARVMSVLLLTSIGSVVFFGLAPALHLSNVRPADGLASGGRAATRTRRRWWIATFLAVEFALTLVLACSVALGMRFNQAARTAQHEFDTSRIFTASITLSPQTYAHADARNRFYHRLESELATMTSVVAANVVSAIPGGGGPQRAVTIAGRTANRDGEAAATTVAAGDDYFRTLGVGLVRGGSFGGNGGASADGGSRGQSAVRGPAFPEPGSDRAVDSPRAAAWGAQPIRLRRGCGSSAWHPTSGSSRRGHPSPTPWCTSLDDCSRQ